MRLLFLDWESFYDTKGGYTLSGKKGLSTVEYVRDRRFKPHGFSYSWDLDGPVVWVTESKSKEFFDTVDWANTVVIAHNTKFDGFILRQHYGIQPGAWICTKALSHAVLGKTIKGHSLASLAMFFELPSKGTMRTDGIRDLTPEQEKELSIYGCHDTWLCREIYKRLIVRFPENQLPIVSWTIDTFVNPRLMLDVPLLRKAAADEIHDKRKKFRALNIDGSVFRSSDKFSALLKERGYSVPYKESPKQKNEDGTAKKIPALALGDTEFVDMLKSPDETLRILCEARKAAKSNIIETRSKRLASIGRTGSWAFDVEYSGADQTQRFSGGSAAGGNAQNFTNGSPLRYGVLAPNYFSLVVGDSAQIEARFVAYLSGDPELIRIIENEPDLYCDYGRRIYKRVITKKDIIERKISKEGVLGLGYNMGPDKFQLRVKLRTGIKLTDQEAYEFVHVYRNTYVEVPRLWKMLDDFIVHLTDGGSGQLGTLPMRYGPNCLVLPSGLTIQYPNLRQEYDERFDRMGWVYDTWVKGKYIQAKLYGGKMLENICQALAGEHCKEVLAQFTDVCYGQNHDELILVVPEKQAWLYGRRLQLALSKSPSWFKQIHLDAEVKIGKNWGVCK